MQKSLVDKLKDRLVGEKWTSSDEKFLSLTLNSLRVLRYSDDGKLLSPYKDDDFETSSHRVTVIINEDRIVKDIFNG